MGSRGSSCKRTVKPHNSSTPLHAVPKTRAAVQHGAAETQVQDQASHRNKLAVSSTSAPRSSSASSTSSYTATQRLGAPWSG
jgi:hypothetical protein